MPIEHLTPNPIIVKNNATTGCSTDKKDEQTNSKSVIPVPVKPIDSIKLLESYRQGNSSIQNLSDRVIIILKPEKIENAKSAVHAYIQEINKYLSSFRKEFVTFAGYEASITQFKMTTMCDGLINNFNKGRKGTINKDDLLQHRNARQIVNQEKELSRDDFDKEYLQMEKKVKEYLGIQEDLSKCQKLLIKNGLSQVG